MGEEGREGQVFSIQYSVFSVQRSEAGGLRSGKIFMLVEACGALLKLVAGDLPARRRLWRVLSTRTRLRSELRRAGEDEDEEDRGGVGPPGF
jgi:hypothetical protein